jgi:putative flavoprotein involved in K+ transport
VELERAIEEHVSRTGLDAPPSPGESALAPVAGLADSIHDLGTAGIGSVIWATGYSLDFAWIELPIFDDRGEPVQRRGVTAAPGIYFLGLKRQYKMKSSLLSGVGEDAAYLAERFA